MRKWTVFAAGLMLAVGAGQVAAAPASEAQVRDLMQVMGVQQSLSMMNQQITAVMQQRMPCVPASYWGTFIDQSNSTQLMTGMIPAFQKRFTAEDIDGLLKFYRSPLGQKVITQMPQVMADNVKLNQQWGQQRGTQMIDQLKAQGRLDAQGQCPATPASPAPAAKPAGKK
jgi:hypothetical protein